MRFYFTTLVFLIFYTQLLSWTNPIKLNESIYIEVMNNQKEKDSKIIMWKELNIDTEESKLYIQRINSEGSYIFEEPLEITLTHLQSTGEVIAEIDNGDFVISINDGETTSLIRYDETGNQIASINTQNFVSGEFDENGNFLCLSYSEDFELHCMLYDNYWNEILSQTFPICQNYYPEEPAYITLHENKFYCFYREQALLKFRTFEIGNTVQISQPITLDSLSSFKRAIFHQGKIYIAWMSLHHRLFFQIYNDDLTPVLSEPFQNDLPYFELGDINIVPYQNSIFLLSTCQSIRVFRFNTSGELISSVSHYEPGEYFRKAGIVGNQLFVQGTTCVKIFPVNDQGVDFDNTVQCLEMQHRMNQLSVYNNGFILSSLAVFDDQYGYYSVKYSSDSFGYELIQESDRTRSYINLDESNGYLHVFFEDKLNTEKGYWYKFDNQGSNYPNSSVVGFTFPSASDYNHLLSDYQVKVIEDSPFIVRNYSQGICSVNRIYGLYDIQGNLIYAGTLYVLQGEYYSFPNYLLLKHNDEIFYLYKIIEGVAGGSLASDKFQAEENAWLRINELEGFWDINAVSGNSAVISGIVYTAFYNYNTNTSELPQTIPINQTGNPSFFSSNGYAFLVYNQAGGNFITAFNNEEMIEILNSNEEDLVIADIFYYEDYFYLISFDDNYNIFMKKIDRDNPNDSIEYKIALNAYYIHKFQMYEDKFIAIYNSNDNGDLSTSYTVFDTEGNITADNVNLYSGLDRYSFRESIVLDNSIYVVYHKRHEGYYCYYLQKSNFSDTYLPDSHISEIDDFKSSIYPNPYYYSESSRNHNIVINFYLPEKADVSLILYNIKGQKVAVINDDKRNQGFHSINWNAKDEKGNSLGTGVYFCQFNINGINKSVKKILLLK